LEQCESKNGHAGTDLADTEHTCTSNIAIKGVKRSCQKLIKKKKELQQVNGTGFSDPTAFYHLWAYCKKEVSKTRKNYQHKNKERCKECIDGIKYSTRQKVKSESTDTYNYFCPL
jgi:hypothetical protein